MWRHKQRLTGHLFRILSFSRWYALDWNMLNIFKYLPKRNAKSTYVSAHLSIKNTNIVAKFRLWSGIHHKWVDASVDKHRSGKWYTWFSGKQIAHYIFFDFTMVLSKSGGISPFSGYRILYPGTLSYIKVFAILLQIAHLYLQMSCGNLT